MSRADSTLNDFLGVDDAEPSDEEERTHDAVTAVSWEPDGVQCQCGADITEWHAPAQARRLARAYGDESEQVPACPNCVEWGSANHDKQNVKSVPHAIKAFKPTSSVERRSRRELALQEVSRDE